jgi:hypothetical protein
LQLHLHLQPWIPATNHLAFQIQIKAAPFSFLYHSHHHDKPNLQSPSSSTNPCSPKAAPNHHLQTQTHFQYLISQSTPPSITPPSITSAQPITTPFHHLSLAAPQFHHQFKITQTPSHWPCFEPPVHTVADSATNEEKK